MPDGENVDISSSVSTALMPAPTAVVAMPLPASLFPESGLGPSFAYERFAHIRQTLQKLIRQQTPAKEKLITEVTNALLQGDKEPPKGLVSFAFSVLGLAHRLKASREKRQRFADVTNALLEMIHDPLLECKMTKKDILDVFESNGISRDKVSHNQIGSIYVHVLQALKVGKLRDASWSEPLLLPYIKLKIDEITFSRQQWEIGI